MRPSPNLKAGLAAANPSLYCSEEDAPDLDTTTASPSSSAAGGDAVSDQPHNKPAAAAAAPRGPDPSTFDAVKAAQYGAFDRLRQLVEEDPVRFMPVNVHRDVLTFVPEYNHDSFFMFCSCSECWRC